MWKIMRLALLGFASGAAMGAVTTWAGPARAGVFFDYAGVCAAACGEVGLVAGDAVGGYVEIATAAVAPNAALAETDILSFAFDFGGFSIKSPGDALIVINGDAFLDATADGFTGTGVLQFRLGGITNVGGILLFDSENWHAAPPPDFDNAFGTGDFSRRPAPEPAALGVLGLGLAGLLACRRRGRGGFSAAPPPAPRPGRGARRTAC